MRRSLLRFCLLGLVALAGDSCLIRSIPIPPPGVTAQASTRCSAEQGCSDDGRVVRIAGLARSGALVIVQHRSRYLPDGRPYTASTFAQAVPAAPDAGEVTLGNYELWLFPVPDPEGGPPTVCRLGDELSVYQLVRNAEGLWEQSSERTVRVEDGP